MNQRETSVRVDVESTMDAATSHDAPAVEDYSMVPVDQDDDHCR